MKWRGIKVEVARCGEISVLLDQLEDLMEQGKTNFISGKLTIDKQSMAEIIRDIRLKLPSEVQQSVWIVEERNKIINEAQNEAQLIIQEAQEQVQDMIDKDRITVYAKEKAEQLLSKARLDAKDMHIGAINYAHDTCKDVEQRLKYTLDCMHQEVQSFEGYITDLLRDVYDNRQELKEMENKIE